MANDSKTEMADERTEMANERTDWAQERTLLAQERTFSAWARTGTSAMAVGLGIARLLPAVDNPWLARTLGVIMVLAGAAIFIVGFFSYRQALEKLEQEGIRGTSLLVIGIITIGLLASAILALLLVFQNST